MYKVLNAALRMEDAGISPRELSVEVASASAFSPKLLKQGMMEVLFNISSR